MSFTVLIQLGRLLCILRDVFFNTLRLNFLHARQTDYVFLNMEMMLDRLKKYMGKYVLLNVEETQPFWKHCNTWD